MLVFKTDGTISDTSLPTLERDPLLSGDNDGVRFLFDTAFAYSYAGGSATNGKAVVDISEHGNGEFVLASGQAVGFSGNGFDFSTLTSTGTTDARNYVLGGASAWNGIFAAQEYIVCMYIRLPTESDWAVAINLALFASGAGNGYTVEPDPVLLAFSGLKRFEVRRQTAINAQTPTVVVPSAGNYGNLCQVAFWRNAAGVGLRVKGPDGTQLTTGAAGALNSADFSASRPRFGSPGPFTDHSASGASTTRNFRLYRGFIENLALSGRDPTTVLDADYARVVARGVFS